MTESDSRPREALFELALERAEAYLRRARRPASTDPAAIRRALEVWSLKTRFAARFDLDEIAHAVAERAVAVPRRRGRRRRGRRSPRGARRR